MARTNIRAAAILIKDGNILLMQRTSGIKKYWVFPGGGVEEDETIEEAVVREIQEEATIKCKTVKLLYTHIYKDIGHEQYYYLCEYVSGEPALGDFNELKTMQEEDQTYDPQFVGISKLPKLLLYPLEVRDWLIGDLKNGFKDTPKLEKLESSELRQEL